MQANGAEMLRLACCFATEEGIAVCAPVHDAILIEAPVEEIDHIVAGHSVRWPRPAALCWAGSSSGPRLRSFGIPSGTPTPVGARCGTPFKLYSPSGA